jgi:hypothetical protein
LEGREYNKLKRKKRNHVDPKPRVLGVFLILLESLQWIVGYWGDFITCLDFISKFNDSCNARIIEFWVVFHRKLNKLVFKHIYHVKVS